MEPAALQTWQNTALRPLPGVTFQRPPCTSITGCKSPLQEQPNRTLWHLGLAGGLFGLGLLLRRVPAKPSAFKLISADWKDWAKMALGVLSVGEVNKAMTWRPAPWLGAIESVAVINPLVAGFSKRSMGQMLTMAPLIAGLVQGAQELHQYAAPQLKDRFKIPEWVTRLAVSAASIGVGLKVFPLMHRTVGSTIGTGAMMCSRGCCQALVCMNEIADFCGGFANWFKRQFIPLQEK